MRPLSEECTRIIGMDMNTPVDGADPERAAPSNGVTLVTLPFWAASLIGIVLLVLAGVTAANGSLVGMWLWLVFTVGWLIWTLIVGFVNAPAQPFRASAQPIQNGHSELAALSPEQHPRWKKSERELRARREAASAGWREANRHVGQRPWVLGDADDTRHVERTPEQLQALRYRGTVADAPRPTHSPKPAPQPLGVSHKGAEKLVEMWMTHLGISDAKVTSFTQDGGIDVVSGSFVAQVKNYAGSVGAPEVQQLAGVMHIEQRRGLFFTSGSYTLQAQSVAERAKIGLFVYSAEEGTLFGVNAYAKDAVANGIPIAYGIAPR